MSKEVKTPEVGDEIFTTCGKCKSEMYHVVTSVENDVIKKVMCKGCNSTHAYKAPKAKKKTAKSKAADDKPKKITRRRTKTMDWDTLLESFEEEQFVDYEITGDFTQAAALRHKTFGDGVIVKVLSETQLEVRFQDAIKILVHNYVTQ